MRAVVTPAVRAVIGLQPPQPLAAELVLVAPLIRLEVGGLVPLPAPCEHSAVHVHTARPDAAEAGPVRPHVVIHLPARPEPVSLIGRPARVDHLPAGGGAAGGEAVQRGQRPGAAGGPTAAPRRRAGR